MKEITLKAPAKINFSIDVAARLENGYHSVEMIMQAVSLYDTVTVEKCPKGISLFCDQPAVPNNSDNIAWKAAEVFFEGFAHKGGAKICLYKNIPVSAGLAGGSTNAAAVLKALNQLYDYPFSKKKLWELSSKLGVDVAFCLEGGTALATGIGNELTPLPDFAGVWVVLVKPFFSVSTPWVYKNLKLDSMGERPDTEALINCIKARNTKALAQGMRNVLESVTIKAFPDIKEIMDRLMGLGALGARMSGSGPTAFGIFENRSKAIRASEHLKTQYENVFAVKTIERGEKKDG